MATESIAAPSGSVFAMPPLEGRRRLVILDFYRFVAALAVFLYHLQDLDRGKLFFVGSYGLFVDMFFVLSGFVLALTYDQERWGNASYSKFMVRRMGRVYPLHLACLIVTIVGIATSHAYDAVSHTPAQLIENLLLIQAWGTSASKSFNIPSWSISAELFCYILFPLLLVSLRRAGILLGAGIVMLVYAILGHAHLPIWIGNAQMYGANVDYGILRALPSFCAGILLFHGYKRIGRVESKLWLAGGVGAMALVFVVIKVAAKPDLVMLLFFAAILMTAVGERSLTRDVAGKYWLERLGDTSYAVYLTQMPFIFLLLAPLWSAIRSNVDFYLFTIMAIILLVGFSDIVFRLFENPARRAINRAFDAHAKRDVAKTPR